MVEIQRHLDLNVDLKELATKIQVYLKEKNFEVAYSRDPIRFCIQATKSTNLRAVVGMRRSIDITVKGEPNNFEVSLTIGQLKKNVISATMTSIPISIFTGGWGTIAPIGTALYMNKRFRNDVCNFISEQARNLRDTGRIIINPFVGPRPFTRNTEDRARFFGREKEAYEIITLILAHKLVLIYSQSGAGKTSIFNASVIPELEMEGFQVLPVARIGGPKNILLEQFPSNIDARSSNSSNAYILNALQSISNVDTSEIMHMSLGTFLNKYFPAQEENERVLLFDQLEEIFGFLPGDNWFEQQKEFFMQIDEALSNDPLLRIVFIIREDYLAHFDPFTSFLPEKLRPRLRLERLRKDAALEALKGPLEGARVHVDVRVIDKLFDEGIIDKLIDDLLKIRVETFGGQFREIKGEFVEPIHLQVVCQRLWNKLMTSQIDQITQDSFGLYLGDVDRALEDFYVEVIGKTSKQTGISEETIRNWFEEKLITSSGTRSVVHREPEVTGGLSNKVVDILENKYLIRKEEHAGALWYELTHDRLIKPIKDSNIKWLDARERKRKKDAE